MGGGFICVKRAGAGKIPKEEWVPCVGASDLYLAKLALRNLEEAHFDDVFGKLRLICRVSVEATSISRSFERDVGSWFEFEDDGDGNAACNLKKHTDTMA